MDNKRILKVNAEIKRILSDIFLYELENPKVDGLVSIIKVTTAPDLEYSRIYLSIFNSQNQEEAFEAIKHSSAFIRRQLASKIIIRKIPNLEFYLDKSDEALQNIEELIAQTKKED